MATRGSIPYAALLNYTRHYIHLFKRPSTMYPPSRVATDRPSPVGLIIYCPVERDILQRLLPHRRQNTLDVSPITGQPSVSVRRLCVEPREYDDCYESTHPRWTQHKYITWNYSYSVSSSSASASGPWVCPRDDHRWSYGGHQVSYRLMAVYR